MIAVAELWTLSAIFWGLFLCHNIEITRIWLETDFASTKLLIEEDIPNARAHIVVVNATGNLLVEDWLVVISHMQIVVRTN